MCRGASGVSNCHTTLERLVAYFVIRVVECFNLVFLIVGKGFLPRLDDLVAPVHAVATCITIGEASIVAWAIKTICRLVVPHSLVTIARTVARIVFAEESVVGRHQRLLLNLAHRVDVLEHGVAGSFNIAEQGSLDVVLRILKMSIELLIHRHSLLHIYCPRTILLLKDSNLVGSTYYIIGGVTYEHISIAAHIVHS